MKEQKSLRGRLVEFIIKHFIESNLFTRYNDDIKDILQSELDMNLKFETEVHDIKAESEHTTGKIYFKDEKGEPRIVDFAICVGSKN